MGDNDKRDNGKRRRTMEKMENNKHVKQIQHRAFL